MVAPGRGVTIRTLRVASTDEGLDAVLGPAGGAALTDAAPASCASEPGLAAAGPATAPPERFLAADSGATSLLSDACAEGLAGETIEAALSAAACTAAGTAACSVGTLMSGMGAGFTAADGPEARSRGGFWTVAGAAAVRGGAPAGEAAAVRVGALAGGAEAVRVGVLAAGPAAARGGALAAGAAAVRGGGPAACAAWAAAAATARSRSFLPGASPAQAPG